MKQIFPDKMLSSHIAVVGMTGLGKTSTLKLIIEQAAAAGARVCVLDTVKSDHWGLISSADGKKPGLPFTILGGDHGHLPLHETSGKALGEIVGKGALRLSIIDMADFKMGGAQKFFCEFAEAIWKNVKGVIYLVIEEAHEIAPKERAGFGAENMSVFWAKKLATGSRSKGIRLIVATQRTQALHNAVLGSCTTLVTHGLAIPADQKPIVDWLEGHVGKEKANIVKSELASLPVGTGYIVSGRLDIFEKKAFPRIKTFDNSATPEDGDEQRDVVAAKIDQAELRKIIGDAVKKAEDEDPKQLRAKLIAKDRETAQLNAEIAKLKSSPAQIDTDALKKAEERGFKQAEQKLTAEMERTAQARIVEFLGKVGQCIGPLMTLLQDSMKDSKKRPTFDPVQFTTHVHVAQVARPAPSVPPQMPSRAKSATPNDGTAAEIGKGERIILTAIAQSPNGCTREQLTVMTGYKRSSRDTYIQRLGSAGLLLPNGNRLLATEDGVTALGSDYEPLPTGLALQEKVLKDLPEGERRVLEVLIPAYPNAVERDTISDATGYKRSSRDTYLQRLSSRELIVTDRAGARANANLFD